MKILLSSLLLMLVLFGSTQVYAAVKTAGGATIHNAVTVQYNGFSSKVAVDVKVRTIGVAPTISVDTTTQSTTPAAQVTYNYTVVNNSNGLDTFSFTATSLDAGGIAAPTMNLAGTGVASATLSLAASITSAANTVVNTLVIPAGSEVGFTVGDTVKILNNVYLVSNVIAGAPQSLAGAEVPSVITVQPIGASPVLAVGAIGAGIQFGEQKTISLLLTAGAPSGSHTVNLNGVTTANALASNAPVTYTTSQASGNETVTIVAPAQIIFVKDVRNVSLKGAFARSGVQAQSTNILEYRITLTEPTNVIPQVAAVLTDEVPLLTTYIPGTTTLNGAPVADGAGGTLPLSAANGGLQVNSPGAAVGVIAPGKTATVIFRVSVN